MNKIITGLPPPGRALSCSLPLAVGACFFFLHQVNITDTAALAESRALAEQAEMNY